MVLNCYMRKHVILSAFISITFVQIIISLIYYSSNRYTKEHTSDSKVQNKKWLSTFSPDSCHGIFRLNETCQQISWNSRYGLRFMILGSPDSGANELWEIVHSHVHLRCLNDPERILETTKYVQPKAKICTPNTSDTSNFFDEKHGVPLIPTLIVIRDPVERCESEMQGKALRNIDGLHVSSNITLKLDENSDFTQLSSSMKQNNMLKNQFSSRNCILEGNYYDMIARLLERGHSPLNMRIYWYSQLIEHPSAVLHDAFKFMGLNPEYSRIRKNRIQIIKSNEALNLHPNLWLTNAFKIRMYKYYKQYDDKLGLLLHENVPWSYKSENPFQKIVWMLWDKGIENAPKNVITCYKSWIFHNPDYEVHLMNLNEAEEKIGIYDAINEKVWNQMSIEAKSDVIRAMILFKFGGVWADATLLCMKPLSQWLDVRKPFTGFIRKDSGTLGERNIVEGKIVADPWIASWFIAVSGRGQTYLMKRIVEKIIVYWKDRYKSHYFWFHRIVGELYNSDSTIELMLRNLEDARGPHCLAENHLEQKVLKRCWIKRNISYTSSENEDI